MIWLPAHLGHLRRRDVVELSPAQVKALVLFADAFPHMKLDIVCGRCGHPCRGENTGHEPYLSMRCQCREYRGRNPYRPAA